jgi:hypothetical protein
MIIEFGKGQIFVQANPKTQSIGLFFTEKPHEIGHTLNTQKEVDTFVEEELIEEKTIHLYFSNLASIRVLQAHVNALISTMENL